MSHFSASEKFAMGAIQRATLDLLWIREASNIRGIINGLQKLVGCAKLSGRRVTLEDTTT